MKRIIYCSEACDEFTPDELVDLLGVARRNNSSADVSGMLLYCSRSFLQMLEGPDQAVDTVYARIAEDGRHVNLRVLCTEPVRARLFPDWTMGFEHLDDEELAEQFDGFTPAVEYPLVNPGLVTNAVVAQTLLTLYARNRAA